MTVKDEYLAYRDSNNLRTGVFADRVKLQTFLRDRLEKIWSERPDFSHGGLLANYMTHYSIGFSYYDCRPTSFCRSRCYGLPIAGLHDYYMLRLSVLASESLKTGDRRYLDSVGRFLKTEDLKCLKIGHWGDATPAQIPHIAKLVDAIPSMAFWWYTRKPEIALEVNRLSLSNLRCYLSLDPTTDFPSESDYPYGLTYLFGDGFKHTKHSEILADRRLIAVFPLKRGSKIEEPGRLGIGDHPRLCIEKRWRALVGAKGEGLCLTCVGRCNYSGQARKGKGAILLKREKSLSAQDWKITPIRSVSLTRLFP